ncbi:hypothetical protein J7J63_01125 [Candidatus Bipolaricaulota bacterium]|nr:hypothetical protein [Candidatus Bipolaricaulota bacterium]
MKRVISLAIVLLVASMFSVVAVSQDDGLSFCATFSGNGNLLPSASGSFGINLKMSLASFSATSDTTFSVLPTFGVNQSFNMEYALAPLTFGMDVYFAVVPLLFQSWDAYARLDLPNTGIGDTLSFGGYFLVKAFILPSFSSTGTLYLSMSASAFSASSKSVVSIVPLSFQTQRFDLSVDFLSPMLGDDSPTLGARVDVLPSLATTVWLDASLALDALTMRSYTSLDVVPTVAGTQEFTLTYQVESVTLTSRTTFALSPIGFDSEYVKINVVYEGFSVYGWAEFAPSGLSAGVGFSYNFCTNSN